LWIGNASKATTGLASKAAILYITAYISKSELSHIQTVTLLKVAVEKINANEYDKPDAQANGLSPGEAKG
jgi:hypothetical protein